jgi:hypothetical protein
MPSHAARYGGGYPFHDWESGPQSEEEARAEMEGLERDAEALQREAGARMNRAREQAARSLGMRMSDVPEAEVQRHYEQLERVEGVQRWPTYAMLYLPVQYRPDQLSWWTNHQWGEELVHVVQVFPGSGLVGRGARTGREEALQLLHERTGAPIEDLRGLLLEEHPEMEPWMVDGWETKYKARKAVGS